MSFCFGCHDEWNIARAVNTERRDVDKVAGIVKQLGALLDVRAIPPGLPEAPVSCEDAGRRGLLSRANRNIFAWSEDCGFLTHLRYTQRGARALFKL